MTFPDLTADIARLMPGLRGKISANEPLASYTWFRVGGPAQTLFMPADEADLAYFLSHLPRDLPVTVIDLGVILILRDGGVAVVVIRLSASALCPSRPATLLAVSGRRSSRDSSCPPGIGRSSRDRQPGAAVL